MFRKLPLESDKDVERRSQAYTTCWTDIRQRIEVSRETLSVADRICVCMLASFPLLYKVNNSDKHKKSLMNIPNYMFASSVYQLSVPSLKALTSRQHDKVFQDILKFISRASKQLDKLNQLTTAVSKPLPPPPSGAWQSTGDTGADTKLLPPRLEVPTVALVAGVNMPDHDVLFEQLRTSIRMDGISPHVVLLKSKDCNSGR